MNDKNIKNSPGAAEPAEGEPASTVSERKLKANQQNAKKSTGPKTPRGKAHSRFNALTHGMLAKCAMLSPDCKSFDPGLLELLEGLRDKYGRDDVRTELLVDGVVAAYWRHGMAIAYERKRAYSDGRKGISDCMHFPNVPRYETTSLNAMLKNLQLLDEGLAEERKVEEADAEPAADAAQPDEVVPESTGDDASPAQPAQAVSPAAADDAPAPQPAQAVSPAAADDASAPQPAQAVPSPVVDDAPVPQPAQAVSPAAADDASAPQPAQAVPPPVAEDAPQAPQAEGDEGQAGAGVSAPEADPQGPASAEPPADPGVPQAA
jgi:hypothetical protein